MYFSGLVLEMVTKQLQILLQTSYMYFRGLVLENGNKMITKQLQTFVRLPFGKWLQTSYMYSRGLF